jgi:DNA-binding response OmpR family regulator
MPEMNGYELCRHIRADNSLADLPVILLTALSNAEDVFKGLECGADNFLTKPYDPASLVARVEFLLANVHLGNREKVQTSMEVLVAGRKHVITSDRAQILNLLLSTYEAAVQRPGTCSGAGCIDETQCG